MPDTKFPAATQATIDAINRQFDGALFLTAAQAAKAMACSEMAMRMRMHRGAVPSVLIGGRRLVPVEALAAHIDEAMSAA